MTILTRLRVVNPARTLYHVRTMKKDTYTLDVRKWRCGTFYPTRLGEGNTLMLNDSGCMCCLGQFAKGRGVSEDVLLYAGAPCGVWRKAGHYDSRFVTPEGEDTQLACCLMAVNDGFSTPAEKIATIRRLLADSGAELVVVDPDNILGGA